MPRKCKATSGKRSAKVTNECFANALPVNVWLTKAQISAFTNINTVTLPPRLRVLVNNNYLDRREGGNRFIQWKMNENQKRWLIQSTKNGDVETGKRGQQKVRSGRAPIRKVPVNKFSKCWDHLHSVGFI